MLQLWSGIHNDLPAPKKDLLKNSWGSKNICLNTLQCNLDMDNCVKFLIIGDMYQEQSLKEMAAQMVIENKEKIISSNAWKQFTENHLELALEVATLGWNQMKV